MKKVLAILLCICMLFSLVACNSTVTDTTNAVDNNISDENSSYYENQVPDDVN